MIRGLKTGQGRLSRGVLPEGKDNGYCRLVVGMTVLGSMESMDRNSKLEEIFIFEVRGRRGSKRGYNDLVGIRWVVSSRIGVVGG